MNWELLVDALEKLSKEKDNTELTKNTKKAAAIALVEVKCQLEVATPENAPELDYKLLKKIDKQILGMMLLIGSSLFLAQVE